MRIRHMYLAYLLLVFVQMAGRTSRAAEPVPELSLVKAAMVYHMTKYVDWPSGAFERAESPLLICTVGNGSMTDAMGGLQGKPLKGRSITVHKLSGPSESRSCHVLVIGNVDKNMQQMLINKTLQHAVLTISDYDGFVRSGGVVGFYLQGSKLRFEISIESAEEHYLAIGSQLLKLARIVRRNEP